MTFSPLVKSFYSSENKPGPKGKPLSFGQSSSIFAMKKTVAPTKKPVVPSVFQKAKPKPSVFKKPADPLVKIEEVKPAEVAAKENSPPKGSQENGGSEEKEQEKDELDLFMAEIAKQAPPALKKDLPQNEELILDEEDEVAHQKAVQKYTS